ncbi:MAG: type II toxin-antitoxin system VapC family toxin [Gammaproteobacteria bacterium]|nr:type II toxin-antitoxin system VapC family toxin [Gammaproteobacteria bacterium]
MIAVDTNVLLRHVLQDDPDQSSRASAVMARHSSVLITDVVLVECLWTLCGRKYQASRDDIAKLINDLLCEPRVVFENPQAVWAALNAFMADYPPQDVDGRRRKLPYFADALIVHKSRVLAHQAGERLDGVYTFDSGALHIAGTERP